MVTHQGVADIAPAGSGLPDLTTGWQYHTFSAFNGLQGSGFLRVVVANPEDSRDVTSRCELADVHPPYPFANWKRFRIINIAGFTHAR